METPRKFFSRTSALLQHTNMSQPRTASSDLRSAQQEANQRSQPALELKLPLLDAKEPRKRCCEVGVLLLSATIPDPCLWWALTLGETACLANSLRCVYGMFEGASYTCMLTFSMDKLKMEVPVMLTVNMFLDHSVFHYPSKPLSRELSTRIRHTLRCSSGQRKRHATPEKAVVVQLEELTRLIPHHAEPLQIIHTHATQTSQSHLNSFDRRRLRKVKQPRRRSSEGRGDLA